MVESGKTLIIPLIRNLPDKSGGIQKGVFQLYDDLRAKGFQVEFILNSDIEEVSFYDGFKINHLKFPPIYTFLFSKRYFEYLRCKKIIFNFIQKHYPNKEILFVGHWAPDFMLLSELSFKFKTIFSFHGPYHVRKFKDLCTRKQFWLKKFEHKLASINQFVFISNVLYDDATKNFNVPKEKSIVIKNGIVIKHNKVSTNNEYVKFVMATRLVKNKNIDFVLKALSILKSDGLKFSCDIYGDGSEEEELRCFINSNLLEDYVVLKGYNANIDKLLFEYDYYISASFFEGMPRGPLEAINNNVIPILSDIPTHREIIPAEVDVFFSLEDSLSLVNKIKEIINISTKEKASLLGSLKQNLIRKYDVQIRFKEFQNLFTSIIK